MPTLIMRRDDSTTEFELKKTTSLGRSSDNTITVPSSSSSRNHARIISEHGISTLEDLSSANGTKVNGDKITRHMLRDGDKFLIGDVEFTYHEQISGQLINRRIGDYLISKAIGSGGMGAVYLAQQLGLNRQVALKVLKPELAEKPGFVEDFFREAKLAGQLNHPNIIAVYDVGQDAGHYYLSMEYIEGEDLADTLKRKGKLTPYEVIDYSQQTAEGLHYAHQQGITHQDIKPRNIMLTANGVVKIADLGLAKTMTYDNPENSETSAKGTPYYIPPEVIRMQPPDSRSDIYSLCASMFYLATGQPPYAAKRPADVVRMHIEEPVPDPREVAKIPDELADLIMEGMSKDPARRPETAKALSESLMAMKHNHEEPPTPSSITARFKKRIAKKSGVSRQTIVVATILMLMVACAIVFKKFIAPPMVGNTTETKIIKDPVKQLEKKPAPKAVKTPAAPPGKIKPIKPPNSKKIDRINYAKSLIEDKEYAQAKAILNKYGLVKGTAIPVTESAESYAIIARHSYKAFFSDYAKFMDACKKLDTSKAKRIAEDARERQFGLAFEQPASDLIEAAQCLTAAKKFVVDIKPDADDETLIVKFKRCSTTKEMSGYCLFLFALGKEKLFGECAARFETSANTPDFMHLLSWEDDKEIAIASMDARTFGLKDNWSGAGWDIDSSNLTSNGDSGDIKYIGGNFFFDDLTIYLEPSISTDHATMTLILETSSTDEKVELKISKNTVQLSAQGSMQITAEYHTSNLRLDFTSRNITVYENDNKLLESKGNPLYGKVAGLSLKSKGEIQFGFSVYRGNSSNTK